MKRSNRLILLIGVFLAIIAFVGILMIFQTRGQTTGPAAAPQTQMTVFAAKPIALGTPITADMLRQAEHPLDARAQTAFADTSLLLGEVVRKDIAEGKQLTADDFETGNAPTADVAPPPGQVAMAVRVNQLSGVGTLIRTGDYVDIVVGFDLAPVDRETAVNVREDVRDFWQHSAKVLLQGTQVLGTLLPPPPAPVEGAEPAEGGEPALVEQEQIVILSVTPQQAEVIKLAQRTTEVDPRIGITLVLRSPEDFRGDDGQPTVPPPVETTGITLQGLIDEYGVLVPDVANIPDVTGGEEESP